MKTFRLIFAVDDRQPEQTISRILNSTMMSISDEELEQLAKEHVTEEQIQNQACQYCLQQFVKKMKGETK